MSNLYCLTGKVLMLKEMLEAEEIEQQVFEDTLESLCIGEELNDVVKLMREYEADMAVYEAEEKLFKAKKEKAKNSIESLKKGLLLYLQRTEQTKVKTGLFTLSTRKSDVVEVMDLDSLEDKFKRVKTTIEPDKTAIKTAIKAGIVVEGAKLNQNTSLQIK